MNYLAWPLILAALVASTAPNGAAQQDDPPRRPNIVLILGDDQAWSDYGFTGHPEIRTPNLDRLAAESLRFDRGYVVSPLCRPSLASIATGLYPQQHGVLANDVDPEDREASDRPVREAFHQFPSLPRLLTTAGYRTHQSGKWWEGSFQDGGFTHGMTHGDPERDGRHGDAGLRIGRHGMQPIFQFVDDSIAAGDPFFVWYAPFLPHTPHNPPADLLAHYRSEGRPPAIARYYAMCEWFDRTCGELLEHLETRELRDDTLILFLADNGWRSAREETSLPKGWWPRFAPRSKGSPFEAGVRTPILISWPGRIAAAQSADLASSVDLLPTITRACGIDSPADLPGIDLLDAAARRDRDAVFGGAWSIHNMVPGDPLATLQYRWIVTRDWKLITRHDGLDTTRYRTVHAWDQVPERLADLRADPTAEDNVVADHPEIATALRDRLQSWLSVPKRQR